MTSSEFVFWSISPCSLSKNSKFKSELIDLDSFSTPTVLIDDKVFYQVDIESFNKALGITQ